MTLPRKLPIGAAIIARLSIACLSLTLFPVAVDAQTELVMFERKGCAWCAQWHQEVGAIYALTPEGHLAPLREVDIDVTTPDLAAAKIAFTPTFLVMKDGVEIGRITGYPGADFFWGLLGKILLDSGAKFDP